MAPLSARWRRKMEPSTRIATSRLPTLFVRRREPIRQLDGKSQPHPDASLIAAAGWLG